MAKPRILVTLAHPDLASSRANKRLLEVARDIEGVTVNDLYARYPDFKIDVKREQQLLLDHDLLVLQFPFYWYSCPALLKEWEDRVLEQGFAFPPGVGDALKGKHWLTVTTAGGSEDAYRSGGFNNYTMSELLRPFQQTANLCGMVWHPPFVVHSILPAGISGYKSLTDEELDRRVGQYDACLREFEV
jgi:glutathione-regulated potassium-efflux system ancillary protein KefG